MLDISHLNEEQKQAVVHEGSPLLIIAGAGTGKTTVITHRISWLIDSGLAKPENILALTFTDKAADEMVDRVESLVKIGYTDMRISTFHAFCEWLLGQHGLDIGLSDRPEVYDKQAVWMLMHDNFQKFNLDYYKPLGNPYRFIDALASHFQRAKDEHITPDEYLAYAEEIRLNADNVEYEEEGKRLTEIANAYHVYNQLLLQKGACDFGDLLMYGLKILKDRPAILSALRARFKYILVDEFQDTNWIQYELVKTLAGNGNGLSVVADDDQSIYKFRGASVANVMRFLDDYAQAQCIALTKNYRSGQKILDSAYACIKHNNPERLEVKKGINKRLISSVDEPGNVRIGFAQKQEDEDNFLADEIVKLSANGEYGNCAVLCRTNAQVGHYADMLDRAGIPVHAYAYRGLFAEPAIMDCLSWFTLLDDVSEDTACYRIMNNSRNPLPTDDIATLSAYIKKKRMSYTEAMRVIGKDQLSEAGANWVNTFFARMEKHQTMMRETTASAMAFAFFEDFEWFAYLGTESAERTSFDVLNTVQAIQSFLEKIADFEEKHEQVLVHNYIAYMGVLTESGYEGDARQICLEKNNRVQVMTVHSSKGLEFDHVFIPQLVHLRFPSTQRHEPIPLPDALIKEQLPEGDVHVQEERRLMYVALTRAKKNIYVSYALDYGGKTKKKPSIFVDEIKGEHQQIESRVSERQAKKQGNEIAEISVPHSFSFTSLNQFKKCPLQYKYAQVIGIPTRGSGALSFGNSIHAVLETFYTRMKQASRAKQTTMFDDEATESGLLKVLSIEELLRIYELTFIDDWYESAEQKLSYRKHGAELLRDFYERESKNGWILPKYIEQSIHFQMDGAVITGKIDRVDEWMGNHTIVDYKTGKPKSDETLSKDDKLQLMIYVMGLEQSTGVRAQRCEFWYVEDGSKIAFEPTDEQLVAAREEVEELIQKIQNSDFKPTPSQFVCDHCPFRAICEFRV